MRTFKLLLLNIFLIVILLLISFLISGILSTFHAFGDCYTCGGNFAFTIASIGVLALQPVLWIKNLTLNYRFLAWIISAGLAIIFYQVMELIAALILNTVQFYPGILIGLISNFFSIVAAFIFSLIAVRRFSATRNSSSKQLQGQAINKENTIQFRIYYWWRSKEQFRIYSFISIVWIIFVLLFTIIFDPFNNGSWSYMNIDQYFQMLFVMSLPIIAGIIKFIYTKYII